jgi:hypothetical protein
MGRSDSRVPVDGLRDLFVASGLSASEVARACGLRGSRGQPNGYLLRVMLGLQATKAGRSRSVYCNRTINRGRAEQIRQAINDLLTPETPEAELERLIVEQEREAGFGAQVDTDRSFPLPLDPTDKTPYAYDHVARCAARQHLIPWLDPTHDEATRELD